MLEYVAEQLNRGVAILRKKMHFRWMREGRTESGDPIFIHRNMQSEWHLLSEMARRCSAAFEFHSGRGQIDSMIPKGEAK